MTHRTTVPDRAAKRRERVARYRAARHARYDYWPSTKAEQAIAAWMAAGTLGDTKAGVLDKLVLAGDRALRDRR